MLVDDEVKVKIKKAAAEARLSISDYCSGMILKGEVVAPLGSRELQLMASLSGMANNLNQAVKRMHQEKALEERVNDVLNVIDQIEKLLP